MAITSFGAVLLVRVTRAQWASFGMPSCFCIAPIGSCCVANGAMLSGGNFTWPLPESPRQASVISTATCLAVVLRTRMVGCKMTFGGSPTAGSGLRKASIGAREVHGLALGLAAGVVRVNISSAEEDLASLPYIKWT